MKEVVIKLNIDMNLYIPSDEITGSSKQNKKKKVEIPSFLRGVSEEIIRILDEEGFQPKRGFSTRFSERNGGFSMYDAYVYELDDYTIRIVLDVRLSDHASKPNLETRSNIRKENMKEVHDEIRVGAATAEVLDVYCKSHDWGIEIFVGGQKEYNKPVTSFEAMERILRGKLQKFVSRYA